MYNLARNRHNNFVSSALIFDWTSNIIMVFVEELIKYESAMENDHNILHHTSIFRKLGSGVGHQKGAVSPGFGESSGWAERKQTVVFVKMNKQSKSHDQLDVSCSLFHFTRQFWKKMEYFYYVVSVHQWNIAGEWVFIYDNGESWSSIRA